MGELCDSLEHRAREALPGPVFAYIEQGARDGRSTAEAIAAWERYRLLPHVLNDVTSVDTSTTLLGTTVRSPFAVAPTTLQRACHRDGEIAMARAVAEAGSLMTVSSNAGSSFADIGETGVAWWLQLYVTADRRACEPLIAKAVQAGARAIVLTLDTPVVGTKYNRGPTIWDIAQPGWLRANFAPEFGARPGDEKARDLSPDDLAWLTSTSGLPVVVKGVLRADDAGRCVDAGAAAVWVSNHGGRQLDYAAATADVLGGVAAAVAGRAEVYVDGGVRNGFHALIALALGASGVFLGRLPVYALAAGGPVEVAGMFDELRRDLLEVLALAGCSSPPSVTRDLLTCPSCAVTGTTRDGFDGTGGAP